MYRTLCMNVYRVELTNRLEPIFVCAGSFKTAISKVYSHIYNWEDRDKYSIVSITYVSPCIY